MEIKHQNMLVKNKFLMTKTEDLEHTCPLEPPPMYPLKRTNSPRSFTAVKEHQQRNYQKKSSTTTTTQKYPRFGACLTNCPRSLKLIVQTYRYQLKQKLTV